ncbi:LOW QUALITY PROTEIN: hypothetical protein M513_04741 [Trichuris suis]|uniref:Clc-like protein n=1 Tax=Trichuris suis TaxID=68888 RepID=A0A085MB02_9BILA|nr:LOW QUALITY PROTEIN: hypothetical protein M513_04741 [Trichuris suis]
MSSPVTRMRIAAQVIGTLFQLVGIGLVLTALLTAAWQVVYIDQTKMLHQHGLWLDCVQVGQSSIVHTADSSGWSCTYKFAEKDRSASGEPTSKTWQIVLALLSGGGLFSVIGLFVSYCICCPRVSSICWVITNTFAAFASAAGIIVFFRSSHELRNRIYLVLTTSYVVRSTLLVMQFFPLNLLCVVFHCTSIQGGNVDRQRSCLFANFCLIPGATTRILVLAGRCSLWPPNGSSLLQHSLLDTGVRRSKLSAVHQYVVEESKDAQHDRLKMAETTSTRTCTIILYTLQIRRY